MQELDFSKDKSGLIERAYNFARKAHEDQKRLSGEPYFIHCEEVAKILDTLGLGEEVIAAGLLHDVLEDTSYTYEELEKEFGKDVVELVDGVTEINTLKRKSVRANNVENIRKMLVSSAKDVRVLIIKLADRLHNMRTLEYHTPEKIKKISRETIDIYATLAYRLGLANIKWELEDLAFRYLEPEIYQDFKYKFSKTRKNREKDIENIIKALSEELKRNNLDVKIFGRPKHFYSIYRKMRLKSLDFEKVQDLIGLRIITDNVERCYEALGIIHNFWKPVPLRLKDYIANPKPNFYQSLHTGILTEDNNLVEVQIRTQEMDDIADGGVAAHWKYKGVSGEERFDRRLSWLKQILEFRDQSPSKFMKSVKIDLFGTNIFAFTPKGQIIELSENSSPIDFAYAVHSDVGEKCTGARVNGRFVSLRYELKTGDVVEILTSKNQRPSRDWLKFVRTSKALSKIRHSLKIRQGVSGRGYNVLKINEEVSHNILHVSGLNDFKVRFSACCGPLPGDELIGYGNTVGTKIIVHKTDCRNVSRIRKKILKVQWLKNFNSELKLKIKALDRVGLFADVLNTIAATGTNVSLASAKNFGADAECTLTINFDGIEHLRDIIDRVKRLADVKKVSLE
ncbi:MAG: (p)ppGpp synthetase [Nanoarchaeota archaeon]|nr:(p)ppGpp synthetase [Nanoarchaeota archaeon]